MDSNILKYAVFWLSLLLTVASVSSFSGGSGISNDPYKIDNCDQLQNISEDLSASYEIVSDIDCSTSTSWNSGKGFDPIGNSTNGFEGELNGKNRTIEGLYIDRSSDHVGLFGKIDQGLVRNLTLENLDIIAKDTLGGIAGYNNGEISDIIVEGNIDGSKNVGSIAGQNIGTITDSENFAITNGSENVGGITGYANGTINRTENHGYVKGELFVGGIAGYLEIGTLSSSSNHGNVTGAEDIGGITGRITFENDDESGVATEGTVIRTYNVANITGGKDIGGISGSNSGYVYQSYNTGTVIGYDRDVGGIIGRDGLGDDVNTYNLGKVRGNKSVGGILGSVNGGGEKNYAAGPVSGNESLGGVVGESTYGTAFDSAYYDNQSTGQTQSVGGTALFTNQMQGEKARGNMSKLDFEKIWRTVEETDPYSSSDGYPIFRTMDRKHQLQAQNIYQTPKKPIFGNPSDEKQAVLRPHKLEVYVPENGGSPVDVRFYDASDDSLIGTANNIQRGKTASVTWNGLDAGKDYSWYAIAEDSDGQHSSVEWSFSTSYIEQGAGTEANPYEINTCRQLQDIEYHLNMSYELKSDVDCSMTSNWNYNSTKGEYMGFDPIGDCGGDSCMDISPEAEENNPFTGTFDGNGYVITDLYINRGEPEEREFNPFGGGFRPMETQFEGSGYTPVASGTGLFAMNGPSGLPGASETPIEINVRNVGLENVNITGNDFVGALTGFGFAKNSYSTGEVKGYNKVGGLMGFGKAVDSYSHANVTGGFEYIGGLIGQGTPPQQVYSTGKVEGNISGNIYAPIQKNGLMGELKLIVEGPKTTSGPGSTGYWDRQSSGVPISELGTGLNTSQMKGEAAKTNMSGFDFSDTWETVDADQPGVTKDGYPVLQIYSKEGKPPNNGGGGTGPPNSLDFTLEWQDRSENEDGFNIYTNVSGSFRFFKSVGENTEEAKVIPAGAVSGRTICFQVRAYNEFGESPPTDGCAKP